MVPVRSAGRALRSAIMRRRSKGRRGIAELDVDGQSVVAGIERKPGLGRGKAGVGRPPVQGIGVRAPSRPSVTRPVDERFRILKPLERNVGLRKAELLALIEEGVAAKRHQKQQGRARESPPGRSRRASG